MEQSLISIPSVEDFLHVPKPRRYLVLDDKCEDADDDCVLYVGGFDEDYEEDISTEKYLARYNQGIQVMDSQGHINVTHLAYWKASSQKDGNPITCALDDNPSSFWQSDGSQPHSLEAYFSKRMEIVQLALFLSVMVDESYTPQIIKVYAGHSPSDATLYKVLEVRNVNGWIALLFGDNRPGDHLLKCQYLSLIHI